MRWLLALGLCMAQPGLAVGRITDFHSTVRIAADGTLAVTERISVEAEGKQIRRGIVRDFPTDYRDRFGNRVVVPFSVQAVKRDGAPERFVLERLGNGARVRIGRADVLLSQGAHIYEIEYTTARQVGHFPDHDELYWNVNGTGWTLPFDHISAEVLLPKAIAAGELRGEAYTGPQGARGRNYQQMFRDGAAGFTSTRGFAPYEGMTIVVGFPKGIVAEPGTLKRAGWFLSENQGVGAGIAGLALTLAFLWWRWLLVGRDPRAGPAFPRYEAPKGLSPAAVRFIDRQGYDDRCFAAALLGMGSRGLIAIKQAGDAYTIDALRKPPFQAGELLPGDVSVWTLVKSGCRIAPAYDPSVKEARQMLERELQLLYVERIFSRNQGSLAVGALAIAGTLGAMFLLDAPLLALFVIGILAFVMLIGFYNWLPAYSVAGRRLEDEIVGLKQYLGIAEKDDMARQEVLNASAPPKTPQEFSRFLPYAVALDVEKTWADRFARALGIAAVTAAVSDWYAQTSSDASPGSGFASLSDFTGSFSGMDSSIASASVAPGSSSGFSSDGGGGGGGGGSSGGGGGGGGGSGW